MSLKRASTPTSTTRLGVYNGGVFAKGNDKDTGVVGTTESRNGSANQAFVWMQWQDPTEENVSTATVHQPLECTPNKLIRSNSIVQGRVHDEGRDDRDS
jgi:hypothetical protein